MDSGNFVCALLLYGLGCWDLYYTKEIKEADVIVIDDTLGKKLWDELVFIERLIRTVDPLTIKWDVIREGIEKLFKEVKRNGVVE